MNKSPRRWAKDWNRRKAPALTENAVTPNEASTALVACLLTRGLLVSKVLEYDYRKDRFHLICYRREDGRLVDVEMPGETVARTVAACRILGGVNQLRRGEEKNAKAARPPTKAEIDRAIA